jgi:hypothetical protein
MTDLLLLGRQPHVLVGSLNAGSMSSLYMHACMHECVYTSCVANRLQLNAGSVYVVYTRVVRNVCVVHVMLAACSSMPSKYTCVYVLIQ